ncbi:MAG: zinc ribbon domain-containing protein [Lachnospiraceae bacterium]|nr:zinc ribbon domain-containing protein [Lachnospiraceae bacterium]
MRCTRCGNELKKGLKFCPRCGTPVPGRKPAGLRRPGLIIGFCIFLLVLLLGIGGAAGYMLGAFDSFLYPALESGKEMPGKEKKKPETEETEGEGEDEEEAEAAEAEPESADRETVPARTLPTEVPTLPRTAAETTAPAREAAAETTAPASTLAAETTAAMPTPAAFQEDGIAYIRQVYNRTVQNQDHYQQTEGRYYTPEGRLVKAVVVNGNPTIDEAMRKNGYSDYRLEYYYDDLSDEEKNPVFLFAVIDGKEYRYYFEQGAFIRRIGPEGSVNDHPDMNSFITALRDEGASYRP